MTRIQESVFFFAECCTVVQWGYLSDRLGRRPVLLLGPLGLTFSMLFFGSSTTFVSLVVSRLFQGVFNGSIGECISYFYSGTHILICLYRSVEHYDSRSTFKLPLGFPSNF